MNKGQTQNVLNMIQFEDLSVTIREIDETYKSDMLAIMDRSPMQSRTIQLSTDRHPDIFRLPTFYYDNFQYFGFFVEDKLLGFALLAIKQSLVNGELKPVFHFTDFYLDKTLRRRNLYYLSGPYIYGQLPGDCKIGYGIFIKGNVPIRAIAEKTETRMEGVPVTRHAATFNVYSLFLMFKKRIKSRFVVRQAQENDLGRMVELLAKDHKDRLFGRDITKESFLQQIETSPDLSLDDYVVALEDGNIIGMVGVWETRSFNRIKIVKYGWGFKVVRLIHSIAAALFGFRPLPQEGRHMQGVFIRDAAIVDHDPAVLRALIAHVYERYRTRDQHVIYCGLVKGDPLEQAMKDFRHEVVESHMVLGVFDPVKPEDVNMKDPFVEYGVL
jgi:hypothetical protein